LLRHFKEEAGFTFFIYWPSSFVTGHYFSIAPAAVVGCDELVFCVKITTHEYILELSK